jgi:5-formaminoimidazole-4-carboxamide-1-beta-D-ribofuranosyl 5'-monophosphate synthetase
MKTLGKMPSNFPNTGIRVHENLKKNVKLMYAQRQMNAKQPLKFTRTGSVNLVMGRATLMKIFKFNNFFLKYIKK